MVSKDEQVKVMRWTDLFEREEGWVKIYLNTAFYDAQRLGIYFTYTRDNWYDEKLEARLLKSSDFDNKGLLSLEPPYFLPPSSPDTTSRRGEIRTTPVSIPGFRFLIREVETKKAAFNNDANLRDDIGKLLETKEYHAALVKISNYNSAQEKK